MKDDFSEGYSLIDRIDDYYGFDNVDDFIIDILSDAIGGGACSHWIDEVEYGSLATKSWLDRENFHGIEKGTFTEEDHMLQSLKDGTLTFFVDGEEITPTYDSFIEAVNSLEERGFTEQAEYFSDGNYDGGDEDLLMQVWLLGDYVYG